MIKLDRLPAARKDALLQLGRNDKAYRALVATIEDELKTAQSQYEQAKEALVSTGTNRDICLNLRARATALTEMFDLLNDIRKI